MNPNLPAWPLSLPQEPFGDEPPKPKPQNNVLSTQMETGPTKLRRRFTAITVPMTIGPLRLTGEQLQVLEDFVRNDLAEVKQFAWKDFRKGTDAAYRFPQGWAGVEEVFVGTDDATATEWYDVTLQVEMMP